jgi:TatA/E family protein of Tat protein translocase
MLPLAFLGSPADIGIILVLALIVFGPKRLPEIGKQLGQAMRELRKVTDEFTGSLHSVQSEVESVYKPVLSPPHEYGNPYAGTSSATVEKAVEHRPYDQAPEDLMAPVVPLHTTEVKAELKSVETKLEPAPPDTTDVKGH